MPITLQDYMTHNAQMNIVGFEHFEYTKAQFRNACDALAQDSQASRLNVLWPAQDNTELFKRLALNQPIPENVGTTSHKYIQKKAEHSTWKHTMQPASGKYLVVRDQLYHKTMHTWRKVIPREELYGILCETHLDKSAPSGRVGHLSRDETYSKLIADAKAAANIDLAYLGDDEVPGQMSAANFSAAVVGSEISKSQVMTFIKQCSCQPANALLHPQQAAPQTLLPPQQPGPQSMQVVAQPLAAQPYPLYQYPLPPYDVDDYNQGQAYPPQYAPQGMQVGPQQPSFLPFPSPPQNGYDYMAEGVYTSPPDSPFGNSQGTWAYDDGSQYANHQQQPQAELGVPAELGDPFALPLGFDNGFEHDFGLFDDGSQYANHQQQQQTQAGLSFPGELNNNNNNQLHGSTMALPPSPVSLTNSGMASPEVSDLANSSYNSNAANSFGDDDFDWMMESLKKY